MRFPNLVVVVAVVCLMALTLIAQVSTIEGDVKGPDGSPAVGAVVKITRTDIKANYSVRTNKEGHYAFCLLYTSPSPRDGLLSRMPSSA